MTVGILPPPSCVHCQQRLIPTEDGADVCRYCIPQFGQPRGKQSQFPPRCPACQEGRAHDKGDLATSADRIAGLEGSRG